MTFAPRLFLDASVWIAAAGSSTGASACVLALCRHGQATGLVSQLVLQEAERNIRTKLDDESLLRFYHTLGALDVVMIRATSATEVAAQARIIHPKDAHVLAAARKGNADTLLTLDKRHFLSPSVLKANLPFAIMTPGEFLRRLTS